MTEREKAARAIGYLEGMSSVMWSLDRSDSPVQVCSEAAAFYDEQIETLRKMLFENGSKDEIEDRFARFKPREIEKGLDRVDHDGD